MAKRKKRMAHVTKLALSKPHTESRTGRVARRGVMTSHDFANFMSGLMSDLIEGKVPPQVAYAACHAGGKLLRIVEMQFKYGNSLEGRYPTGAKAAKLSLADEVRPIPVFSKAKAS